MNFRGSSNQYRRGDWNVICDRCGCKMKRSEARMTWDKLLVCNEDWEPKHPQLFPTPISRGEGRPVNPARPRPEDVFIVQGQNWEDMSTNWENLRMKWEDWDEGYAVTSGSFFTREE